MLPSPNANRGRFPPWLRKRVRPNAGAEVSALVASLGLHTVCQSAHCPNLGECFGQQTAAFLIMGGRCTRACGFCAVRNGRPEPLREDEPQAIAEACSQLALRHVVITSVTRDDLPRGGAEHFARTVAAVRSRLPKTVVEVLIPDFQGDETALNIVLEAGPNILNHNLETAPRLYPALRPEADYKQSLRLLERAGVSNRCRTKSGLMVGLGETKEEVLQVLRDLRRAGCDIVTIGQYLAPSAQHAPVQRFVHPEEFEDYRKEGLALGFSAVASGPLVRSSYHAEEQVSGVRGRELQV